MANHETEGFASVVPHHTLRRSSTNNSNANRPGILSRYISNSSALTPRHSRRQYDSDEEEHPREDGWDIVAEIKAFQEQSERDSAKAKKLGVTWTDLTVKGVGAVCTFPGPVLDLGASSSTQFNYQESCALP